jgi:hypothetical protein
MRTRQKEKKRSDGEGSVFTVRGRWRAQLPYRTDAGVRRFLTKSFDTNGEAQEWMTGKRHGRFQGHSITPRRAPLQCS